MQPEPILTVPELMRIVSWLMLGAGVIQILVGSRTWRSEARPGAAGGANAWEGQNTVCSGMMWLLIGANQLLLGTMDEDLHLTLLLMAMALTWGWQLRLWRRMKRARGSEESFLPQRSPSPPSN